MAEKQNNKERLKEITDSIETGILELLESDKYKSYPQTMGHFHKKTSSKQTKILATGLSNFYYEGLLWQRNYNYFQ